MSEDILYGQDFYSLFIEHGGTGVPQRMRRHMKVFLYSSRFKQFFKIIVINVDSAIFLIKEAHASGWCHKRDNCVKVACLSN